MCGLNWLKPERSVKSVEKAVVSFPRLCSDRCLRKALREYWGFFSLRRIVIPSKYSRWLPVNKQSTEKMAVGKKRPFSAPPQWWSLFWKTLPCDILNTETSIERTVTLGFTLANAFISCQILFTWRFLVIISSFSLQPKELSGHLTLNPACLYCKVSTNCMLFEFNYLNVWSSSASRHVFLSSSWLQLVCRREAVCQASREFRGLFI